VNVSEQNDRQRRVVAWIAGGMPGPQAFRKAGYSKSYSRKAAKVSRRPAFAAALEQERTTLREQVPYDAPTAVREIDRQIALALAAKSPNFMAAAKNLELKCKIYGLVREKIEVTTVDLKGALAEAERRVIQVNLPSGGELSLAAPGAVNGTLRWAASIAGAPVAENPEAGPVDTESVRQVNNLGPENR
jgi:hypothetical protein